MRLSGKSLVAVGAAAVAVSLVPGVAPAAPVGAVADSAVAGTFFSLAPSRVLDTRSGNGVSQGKLGPDSTLHLQITGRGGVPSSGVSAVVLNVTVAGPTTSSFLSVYPTGISRPNASNLNITPGWVGANSVTVPVGTGGKVDVWNQAGSTDVIADVTGFYAADASVTGVGGQFFPGTPWRAADTRDDLPIAPGGTLDVSFDYNDDYDPTNYNSHVRAMVLNITAVDPTGSGFLTAWSGIGEVPNASTLNFTQGKIVPNMAVIPTRPCDDYWCGNAPAVRVQNTGSGNVHIVVDVLGFYDDGTLGEGLNFTPVTPTRITDTRSGLGIPGVLRGGSINTETVPEQFQDPRIVSLSANATGISPTASTFLTFWPNEPGQGRPNASTLNLAPGDVKANATVLTLWIKQFNVFNLAGETNLVVDVSGVFKYLGPLDAASAADSARALSTQSNAGPRKVPTPTEKHQRVVN
jgi:serine protease